LFEDLEALTPRKIKLAVWNIGAPWLRDLRAGEMVGHPYRGNQFGLKRAEEGHSAIKDYKKLPKGTNKQGLEKFAAAHAEQFQNDPEFRTLSNAVVNYTSGSYDDIEEAALSDMKGDPKAWRKEWAAKRGTTAVIEDNTTLHISGNISSKDHPMAKLNSDGEVPVITPLTAEAGSHAILTAIAESPEITTPVYRGMVFDGFEVETILGGESKIKEWADNHMASVKQQQFTTPESIVATQKQVNLKSDKLREMAKLATEGEEITLGIESFSHSKTVAGTFAKGTGGGGSGQGKGAVSVLLQVEGPHNGLNVSGFSTWPHQQEVLMSGKYKVKSVKKELYNTRGWRSYPEGTLTVTLEQVAIYDPNAKG